MRSLATTLTVAAALCRAFELGHYYIRYLRKHGREWWPGCGKEAP